MCFFVKFWGIQDFNIIDLDYAKIVILMYFYNILLQIQYSVTKSINILYAIADRL